MKKYWVTLGVLSFSMAALAFTDLKIGAAYSLTVYRIEKE